MSLIAKKGTTSLSFLDLAGPFSVFYPEVYTLALNSKLLQSRRIEKGEDIMSGKAKLILGILTALAMFALTFTLPKGGPVENAQMVQFPVTVGVWAIFVLLFVKLK
jgi:hypothetical protein